MRDRCIYDNTRYMGDFITGVEGGCVMDSLLKCAFARWSEMGSKERDVCFLFVGDCVLRKDATDYLRKTYVPGRISTFSAVNPYFMRETHVRSLDPNECVLISSKFMRMMEDKQDALSKWIRGFNGSKNIAFGYWCAKAGITTTYVGATVQYCNSNSPPNHEEIETAGDFITSLQEDLVV